MKNITTKTNAGKSCYLHLDKFSNKLLLSSVQFNIKFWHDFGTQNSLEPPMVVK